MAALRDCADIVVAQASGGGLIAACDGGEAKFPDTQVIVAEQRTTDDHALSLRAGRREAHHAKARTICDALMAEIPGEITFGITASCCRGASPRRRRRGAAMASRFVN